jgi:hypothetical protein
LKTSGFSDLKKKLLYSIQPQNLPDYWESFQKILIVSGQFRNTPDSFQFSGLSGNFPECLETFENVWKLFNSLEAYMFVWEPAIFFLNLQPSRKIWIVPRQT